MTQAGFKEKENRTTSPENLHKPEFVGFSENEKKWLQGLLDSFGLPLSNVKRFRKASVEELKQQGMEGTANVAACWDPVAQEIVIIEPENRSEHELRRVLYHELSHGVLDPFSYVEIDFVKMEPVIENGAPKFRPEMLAVFKTPQNVLRFVQFMQYSVVIAIETGVYVDGYQKILGQKFQSLQGDLQILIRKASDPKLSPEDKAKIDKEIKDKEADLQITMGALFKETWAIIMEQAFIKPEGLKQKANAQKKAWDEQGFEKEAYHSIYDEAQYFLRLFYGTDDAGVDKKRVESKKYVEKNLYPTQ